MPANQSTPEVTSHAADMLDQYASFIRNDVKADDFERHPYVPEIEETAQALRDLATPARGGDELREALEITDDTPCVCCCRTRGEHNHKGQCPETSYFVANVPAALASTDMAGAGEVLEACPVCHGDCGSANPPVIFCPMRDVGQEKPTECSVCSGSGEMPLLRNDGIFDYVPCPSCATPPAMPSPVEGLTSEEGWPAYGHWLPDAWDAYLRDLVGWEYMSGWAKLPATFRWSDFYDCLREHAPTATPKATATASVREKARALALAVCDWKSIKNPTQHDEQKLIDAADAVLATLDSGTAATIGGERA